MAERKTRAEIVAEAAKRNKEKQRLKAQKTAAKSGDAQFQRDAANRTARSTPVRPPPQPELLRLSGPRSSIIREVPSNRGPLYIDPQGTVYDSLRDVRLRGDVAQRPPAPMLQTPRASGPQAVRDFGVTRRYPAPARVDTLGLNLDKPRNYAQIRADAPNARTIPPDVRGVQAPRPRTPRGTPILGPAILGAELMTQSDPAQAPLVDPVNNPEDYQRMVELGIDPDQYIEDLIASGDYFVEPDMLAEAVRNVSGMDPAVYDFDLAQLQQDELDLADQAAMQGMDTPGDLAPYLTELAQRQYGGMQGQPLMEQEFFPSPAVEMPNQFDLLTSLMPEPMTPERQAEMAFEQQLAAEDAARNMSMPGESEPFSTYGLGEGIRDLAMSPLIGYQALQERVGRPIADLFRGALGMEELPYQDPDVNYAGDRMGPINMPAYRPDLEPGLAAMRAQPVAAGMQEEPAIASPEDDLRAQIIEQYWQEQAQPQQRFASANDMAANYNAPMQLEELNALLGGIARDRSIAASLAGDPFAGYDPSLFPENALNPERDRGVFVDSMTGATRFEGGQDYIPDAELTGRQTMDDIRLRNAYTQLAFDQLGEAQGVQTDADRLYDSYSTQARAAQFEADQIQENLDRMQRQLVMERDPQRATQIGAAIEVEAAQLAAAQSAAQQARNRQLELFGQDLTGGTDTVDQITAMEQRRAAEADAQRAAQQRMMLQEQQQQLRNQLSDEEWESVLQTQLPTDPTGQAPGQAERNLVLQTLARRYRALTGDYTVALGAVSRLAGLPAEAVAEFANLPMEDQDALLRHPQGIEIFLQEYSGGT